MFKIIQPFILLGKLVVHPGLCETQATTKLFYLIQKKVFQSQDDLQLHSCDMYIVFYFKNLC